MEDFRNQSSQQLTESKGEKNKPSYLLWHHIVNQSQQGSN